MWSSINTHTGNYGRPTAAIWRLHIMFYTWRSTHKRTLHILRWTSAVWLQGAWCRSRRLEGVRYIEMHRGPAYVLGPPPSRGGDLELEGGVNVSLWKYGVVHGTLTWSGIWMSLLDKQEVQDICVGTLHCTLENGADLYVNERQKIRHYHARSAEERRIRRRRKKNAKSWFCLLRAVLTLNLFYYSDVIHSFNLKSAIEHNCCV